MHLWHLAAASALLIPCLASGTPEVKDDLPTPPQGMGWKLTWADEFNAKALDATKWETPPDAPRRDGWWMRRAVMLDGTGNLVLTTFKDGDRYVDGCVRTLGKFEHAFGYYVARVKLQSQVGHWSAFWLMGAGVGKVGDGGRDGTEIDIYEKPWLDDRVQQTLHWDGYGKDHKSEGHVATVPGVLTGWHTFALWWKPDEYVFYVDGKETWRTSAGGVCQVPLYIKLSDEIGSWGGDIKQARLPDQLYVDYVRVYDLVDGRRARLVDPGPSRPAAPARPPETHAQSGKVTIDGTKPPAEIALVQGAVLRVNLPGRFLMSGDPGPASTDQSVLQSASSPVYGGSIDSLPRDDRPVTYVFRAMAPGTAELLIGAGSTLVRVPVTVVEPARR